MPRPKVRPEDRQRSCKACRACKASKIRCDAQLPCASCVRRGRGASCTYSGVDRRRRRHHNLIGTHQDLSRRAQLRHRPILPVVNDHYDYPHLDDDPLNPTFSSGPITPEPTNDRVTNLPLPNGRLLSGLTDEQVYVDGTASLSFLHFLRKTLRSYVGSLSFTDGDRYQTTIEVDVNDIERPVSDVTVEQIYSLLDSYFEDTSGLLDLFTTYETDTLIAERMQTETSTSTPPSPSDVNLDAAALDVALAIGAQARDLGGANAQLGRSYFARAQRVAFEGMLTRQSLGLVRLFLLMAFYMLGACNRNAAAMYLGVAARAAVVIGLHHLASYKNLRTEELEVRLRTWNSLRNIDILSSFILGRPKSLPVMGHGEREMETIDGQVPQDSPLAFKAILKGCSLLEDTVNTLSKGSILHVPTAEGLLEQLRSWSQTFPPPLRQFTFTSSSGPFLDSAERQLLAGNIHVSCVYYFAVMLITRPFLIAYLMSRLRGRAPDQLISDPDEASDVNIKNNTVSKLAQVCVSSAIYMVDMCQRARVSNYNFGNMCLLNAWIFGAGLVLGFSMFAGEPRKDIGNSFEGAREVLDCIAATNQQARLYHEILTSFSEAVKRYHRRVSSEVRRAVHHYIDQILVVNVPPDACIVGRHNPHSSAGNMNGNLESLFAGAVSSSHATMYAQDTSAGVERAQTLMEPAGYGDVQCDWGDIDIQLADNDFLLDVEPFERLFYSIE
ncbi:uncharacterized protein Z518_07373 [Rhinocladiella mackenziei CBS 650.93]|uniref:Zn(2)-C6 fungal-type domain-containing protein n=1 Tax=Rhinocladiella mackenziei CBS 650.93 TaxID=1442369 RepID=A0A0D2J483_9EURO|nr:uncharacterized protein Z518_07373 [Rhinocladiella mackenziei CBS 650.93]KIX03820.1 hypothetical protein Z518_07373 [Rhinocladiella mackenziei CBS 650.93]